jgi:predicted metallo-beta-lactamase superfamily hydrolase
MSTIDEKIKSMVQEMFASEAEAAIVGDELWALLEKSRTVRFVGGPMTNKIKAMVIGGKRIMHIADSEQIALGPNGYLLGTLDDMEALYTSVMNPSKR